MKKPVILGLATVTVAIFGFLALPAGRAWLTASGLLGEERLIRSRVERYWNARVDGDLATMSRYQHPEQPEVAEGGMLVTESFEIRSIQIDGDQAVATIKMHTRLKQPRLSTFERDIIAEDRWVRLDGEWRRDKRPANLRELLRGVQGQLHPSDDSAPDESTPGDETDGGQEEDMPDTKL